jgi:hypothetical protein
MRAIFLSNRLLFAALLATAVGGLIVAFAEEKNQTRPPSKAVQLRIEGELPSLDGAAEWLNSPPLRAADLRGKVVVIDFWT